MDLRQYMQKLHDLCEKGQDKMKPLRKWLDEQGIKWTDNSDVNMIRTHFYINGKHWSVIFGAYSCGAEQGLLELWKQNVNGGESLGFLTVDDITGLIKKELKTNDCFYKCAQKLSELEEENKALKAENAALKLLIEWAEECDFGYDNFPEEYERYKDEIEDMGYIEGMIHIAKRVCQQKSRTDGGTEF